MRRSPRMPTRWLGGGIDAVFLLMDVAPVLAGPQAYLVKALKAGADGKASATATGRGHFGFVLPLNQSPSVTAQLVATNGPCWTSEFHTARRNDATHFSATSD